MRSIIIAFICLALCTSCAAGEPEPPARFVALAEAVAKRSSLDPVTVKAVIEIESRWRPDVKSPAGAVGLMQIMPDTWGWVCKDLLKQSEPWAFADAADPEKNITVGCAYLAWLYEYWHTRLDHVVCDLDTAVIASYNAGQGTVKSAKGKVSGLPAETRAYLIRYGKAKEKFRLQELDAE